MGIGNSLALELAGVDADTPDIAGGEIVRDANGRPTGVLKDNAMRAMVDAVPEPSDRQLDQYLDAAMQYVASNGVTSVHDMFDGTSGGWRSLETYRRADSNNTLITRIYSIMIRSCHYRNGKSSATISRRTGAAMNGCGRAGSRVSWMGRSVHTRLPS
jgi:predicted amidohydrolase YtcJ